MESDLTEDFFDLRDLSERVDLELKKASGRDGAGKLPRSIWETYSAMANSSGGMIILGVDESGTGAVISGIPNPDKLIQDFWDQINNRQIVSVNILSDQAVRKRTLPEGSIITIEVSQADRKQRPVYVGENPLTGTYRRNNEGDYRCPPEIVRQMLGEQAHDTRDGVILDGYTFDDIHLETFKLYRQHFANRQPAHVLNDLENRDFLRQLGGWRHDRKSGNEGLTLAGLLMFGKLRSILDAVPNYIVDFQERLRAVTENRYIDRLTTDFSWSGNLYDFYRLTYAKLVRDLKVPFDLKRDERKEETPIHETIREALVNTLVHADYGGSCSILVVKRPDLFGFRNPGLMRVPQQDAIRGGVSDCRNRNLQKMFQLIGLGEQSGFGFPKIYGNWQQQHWRTPELEERIESNQTLLALRMTSLLPPEAIAALRKRFGAGIDSMSNPERIALVTAYSEGCVTHSRLKELTKEHPRELSQILHSLVEKHFLENDGKGKATFYFLPGEHPMEATGPENAFALGVSLGTIALAEPEKPRSPSSGHLAASSGHLAGSSGHLPEENKPDSPRGDISETEWMSLMDKAKPIRNTGKSPNREIMRQAILEITQAHFLTIGQMADLLDRTKESLRKHYINPMLESGDLIPEYSNIKTHPKQRYRSAKPRPDR